MKLFIFLLLLPFTLFSQSLKTLLSPSFHEQRRVILRSKMPKNSVAVFFANPIRNRSNDINYVYHQDPNFYYLTGLTEPNAMLVLFSEDQKQFNGNNEILFIREKDAFYELWQGEMLGVKGARQKLNINTKATQNFINKPINFKRFDYVFVNQIIDDVRDDKSISFDLFDLIRTFKDNSDYNSKKLSYVQKQIYHFLKSANLTSKEQILSYVKKGYLYDENLKNDILINQFKRAIKGAEFQIVNGLADQKLKNDSNIDFSFLNYHLATMREIKTEEELKLMKKAIKISVIGQIEMMKAMKPYISEREVQGVHEFIYKKYGVGYEGYPSIVGAANNGCTLHYIKNNKPYIEKGELVLMDLGAEYGGYSADITRTIPSNGKFSKEQKAIYNLVLKAQTSGIKAAVVGNKFRQPHFEAKKIINQGLKDLGIIKSVDQKHDYFPHGTSHYLGLDVHDLGTEKELKHNTVITVEPGVYIPKGSKCDKKWWGIGIRIEDDILITNSGPVNLSKDAPRTIEAIEKTMQQKSVLDDFILPEIE